MRIAFLAGLALLCPSAGFFGVLCFLDGGFGGGLHAALADLAAELGIRRVVGGNCLEHFFTCLVSDVKLFLSATRVALGQQVFLLHGVRTLGVLALGAEHVARDESAG